MTTSVDERESQDPELSRLNDTTIEGGSRISARMNRRRFIKGIGITVGPWTLTRRGSPSHAKLDTVSPLYQIDPVTTAGGAAIGALAGELVQGAFQFANSNNEAFVTAGAKVQCPHHPSPQQNTESDIQDVDGIPFADALLEDNLDAVTGPQCVPINTTADDRCEDDHAYAHGEIHYEDVVTGRGVSWGANIDDYGDEWLQLFTYAHEDEEGKAEAAAIAAFGEKGVIKNTTWKAEVEGTPDLPWYERHQVKEVTSENANENKIDPNATSSGDTSSGTSSSGGGSPPTSAPQSTGNAESKRKPSSRKSAAVGMATLGVTPAAFTITRTTDGSATVDPHITSVGLFHDYVQFSDSDTVLFPPTRGMSPQGTQLLTDAWTQALGDGTWRLPTGDHERADVTVAGAAVELRQGTVSAADEQSDATILARYIADESLVRIVAPANAQEGYEPDIVFRRVLEPGESISTSHELASVGSEAVDLATAQERYGWSREHPATTGSGADSAQSGVSDHLRLVIGVEGSLEDGLTRAARDPASPFAPISRRLFDGEVVDLDFNYARLTANEAFDEDAAALTLDEIGLGLERYNENVVHVPFSSWVLKNKRIQVNLLPSDEPDTPLVVRTGSDTRITPERVQVGEPVSGRIDGEVDLYRSDAHLLLRSSEAASLAGELYAANRIRYRPRGIGNWLSYNIGRLGYALYRTLG